MITQNFKNAKILIVDDLDANIEILVELLNLDGYNNIKTTTDSRKVMTIIKSFEPDLILLDLIMPRIDGFEILELIKKGREESLNNNDYVPVLVLTADISTEVKKRALMAGAKDFLNKPYDLFEVRLRIKNLLETRYLFQLLKEKNQSLEKKVVDFLKLNNDWYK